MRSKRALNWLSTAASGVPGVSPALLLWSPGISYSTFGSDFFLRKKVSFHQAGAGSAVAIEMKTDSARRTEREIYIHESVIFMIKDQTVCLNKQINYNQLVFFVF